MSRMRERGGRTEVGIGPDLLGEGVAERAFGTRHAAGAVVAAAQAR